MTPRESVLGALEQDDTGEVASSLFGAGAWSIRLCGETFSSVAKDASLMADVMIKTNKLVGSGIVYVGSGCNNLLISALGGEISFRDPDTPVVVSPLLKDENDLDQLNVDYLESDNFVSTIQEATSLVSEAIGNNCAVAATAWGPFTLSGSLLGLEELMVALYRDPLLVERLLGFSKELLLAFYEPLLDAGTIDLLSLAEPSASGDLISEKHFSTFVAPYVKEIFRWARGKGTYSILHVCGDSTDRLAEMAGTNASCLSLDKKVDLAYAREVLGSKVCIAGNVDPLGVLTQGSVEDAEKAAENCIEAAGRKGFILMPGCDLPPNAKLENVKAMLATARNWKRD